VDGFGFVAGAVHIFHSVMPARFGMSRSQVISCGEGFPAAIANAAPDTLRFAMNDSDSNKLPKSLLGEVYGFHVTKCSMAT
jgi:hypothetical protein